MYKLAALNVPEYEPELCYKSKAAEKPPLLYMYGT